MRPDFFHPDAAREYADAAAYYAQIDPELGGRFYEEIEGLIQGIRREPQRFRRFDPPPQGQNSNVFPYAVISVERPEHVWILALIHRKRRPGYWIGRL